LGQCSIFIGQKLLFKLVAPKRAVGFVVKLLVVAVGVLTATQCFSFPASVETAIALHFKRSTYTPLDLPFSFLTKVDFFQHVKRAASANRPKFV